MLSQNIVKANTTTWTDILLVIHTITHHRELEKVRKKPSKLPTISTHTNTEV